MHLRKIIASGGWNRNIWVLLSGNTGVVIPPLYWTHLPVGTREWCTGFVILQGEVRIRWMPQPADSSLVIVYELVSTILLFSIMRNNKKWRKTKWMYETERSEGVALIRSERTLEAFAGFAMTHDLFSQRDFLRALLRKLRPLYFSSKTSEWKFKWMDEMSEWEYKWMNETERIEGRRHIYIRSERWEGVEEHAMVSDAYRWRLVEFR